MNINTHESESEPMKLLPTKPDITLDHFQQLDIRVGTITRVEDIVDSRKLVKLTVNFGDHSISIMVGMKQERDDPTEIEGLQALFVLNLPEKRMAGHLSQGMLLDLGYGNGINRCLAIPERPVPAGTSAG